MSIQDLVYTIRVGTIRAVEPGIIVFIFFFLHIFQYSPSYYSAFLFACSRHIFVWLVFFISSSMCHLRFTTILPSARTLRLLPPPLPFTPILFPLPPHTHTHFTTPPYDIHKNPDLLSAHISGRHCLSTRSKCHRTCSLCRPGPKERPHTTTTKEQYKCNIFLSSSVFCLAIA
ncbi:hypothetical protein BDY19DRAFT_291506 [Irpex rosettiformis]|uniref:Uncharacterized protein n=1 Tax=Irpex rosettiformis TaxID=378272 RepID=A0ACB8UHT0_9APHY|nr:hypothetical protein BDY19DRAFT_291506 [Irpex rosettiformis]